MIFRLLESNKMAVFIVCFAILLSQQIQPSLTVTGTSNKVKNNEDVDTEAYISKTNKVLNNIGENKQKYNLKERKRNFGDGITKRSGIGYKLDSSEKFKERVRTKPVDKITKPDIKKPMKNRNENSFGKQTKNTGYVDETLLEYTKKLDKILQNTEMKNEVKQKNAFGKKLVDKLPDPKDDVKDALADREELEYQSQIDSIVKKKENPAGKIYKTPTRDKDQIKKIISNLKDGQVNVGNNLEENKATAETMKSKLAKIQKKQRKDEEEMGSVIISNDNTQKALIDLSIDNELLKNKIAELADDKITLETVNKAVKHGVERAVGEVTKSANKVIGGLVKGLKEEETKNNEINKQIQRAREKPHQSATLNSNSNSASGYHPRQYESDKNHAMRKVNNKQTKHMPNLGPHRVNKESKHFDKSSAFQHQNVPMLTKERPLQDRGIPPKQMTNPDDIVMDNNVYDYDGIVDRRAYNKWIQQEIMSELEEEGYNKQNDFENKNSVSKLHTVDNVQPLYNQQYMNGNGIDHSNKVGSMSYREAHAYKGQHSNKQTDFENKNSVSKLHNVDNVQPIHQQYKKGNGIDHSNEVGPMSNREVDAFKGQHSNKQTDFENKNSVSKLHNVDNVQPLHQQYKTGNGIDHSNKAGLMSYREAEAYKGQHSNKQTDVGNKNSVSKLHNVDNVQPLHQQYKKGSGIDHSNKVGPMSYREAEAYPYKGQHSNKQTDFENKNSVSKLHNVDNVQPLHQQYKKGNGIDHSNKVGPMSYREADAYKGQHSRSNKEVKNEHRLPSRSDQMTNKRQWSQVRVTNNDADKPKQIYNHRGRSKYTHQKLKGNGSENDFANSEFIDDFADVVPPKARLWPAHQNDRNQQKGINRHWLDKAIVPLKGVLNASSDDENKLLGHIEDIILPNIEENTPLLETTIQNAQGVDDTTTPVAFQTPMAMEPMIGKHDEKDMNGVNERATLLPKIEITNQWLDDAITVLSNKDKSSYRDHILEQLHQMFSSAAAGTDNVQEKELLNRVIDVIAPRTTEWYPNTSISKRVNNERATPLLNIEITNHWLDDAITVLLNKDKSSYRDHILEQLHQMFSAAAAAGTDNVQEKELLNRVIDVIAPRTTEWYTNTSISKRVHNERATPLLNMEITNQWLDDAITVLSNKDNSSYRDHILEKLHQMFSAVAAGTDNVQEKELLNRVIDVIGPRTTEWYPNTSISKRVHNERATPLPNMEITNQWLDDAITVLSNKDKSSYRDHILEQLHQMFSEAAGSTGNVQEKELLNRVIDVILPRFTEWYPNTSISKRVNNERATPLPNMEITNQWLDDAITVLSNKDNSSYRDHILEKLHQMFSAVAAGTDNVQEKELLNRVIDVILPRSTEWYPNSSISIEPYTQETLKQLVSNNKVAVTRAKEKKSPGQQLLNYIEEALLSTDNNKSETFDVLLRHMKNMIERAIKVNHTGGMVMNVQNLLLDTLYDVDGLPEYSTAQMLTQPNVGKPDEKDMNGDNELVTPLLKMAITNHWLDDAITVLSNNDISAYRDHILDQLRQMFSEETGTDNLQEKELLNRVINVIAPRTTEQYPFSTNSKDPDLEQTQPSLTSNIIGKTQDIQKWVDTFMDPLSNKNVQNSKVDGETLSKLNNLLQETATDQYALYPLQRVTASSGESSSSGKQENIHTVEPNRIDVEVIKPTELLLESSGTLKQSNELWVNNFVNSIPEKGRNKDTALTGEILEKLSKLNYLLESTINPDIKPNPLHHRDISKEVTGKSSISEFTKSMVTHGYNKPTESPMESTLRYEEKSYEEWVDTFVSAIPETQGDAMLINETISKLNDLLESTHNPDNILRHDTSIEEVTEGVKGKTIVSTNDQYMVTQHIEGYIKPADVPMETTERSVEDSSYEWVDKLSNAFPETETNVNSNNTLETLSQLNDLFLSTSNPANPHTYSTSFTKVNIKATKHLVTQPIDNYTKPTKSPIETTGRHVNESNQELWVDTFVNAIPEKGSQEVDVHNKTLANLSKLNGFLQSEPVNTLNLPPLDHDTATKNVTESVVDIPPTTEYMLIEAIEPPIKSTGIPVEESNNDWVENLVNSIPEKGFQGGDMRNNKTLATLSKLNGLLQSEPVNTLNLPPLHHDTANKNVTNGVVDKMNTPPTTEYMLIQPIQPPMKSTEIAVEETNNDWVENIVNAIPEKGSEGGDVRNNKTLATLSKLNGLLQSESVNTLNLPPLDHDAATKNFTKGVVDKMNTPSITEEMLIEPNEPPMKSSEIPAEESNNDWVENIVNAIPGKGSTGDDVLTNKTLATLSKLNEFFRNTPNPVPPLRHDASVTEVPKVEIADKSTIVTITEPMDAVGMKVYKPVEATNIILSTTNQMTKKIPHDTDVQVVKAPESSIIGQLTTAETMKVVELKKVYKPTESTTDQITTVKYTDNTFQPFTHHVPEIQAADVTDNFIVLKATQPSTEVGLNKVYKPSEATAPILSRPTAVNIPIESDLFRNTHANKPPSETVRLEKEHQPTEATDAIDHIATGYVGKTNPVEWVEPLIKQMESNLRSENTNEYFETLSKVNGLLQVTVPDGKISQVKPVFKETSSFKNVSIEYVGTVSNKLKTVESISKESVVPLPNSQEEVIPEVLSKPIANQHTNTRLLKNDTLMKNLVQNLTKIRHKKVQVFHESDKSRKVANDINPLSDLRNNLHLREKQVIDNLRNLVQPKSEGLYDLLKPGNTLPTTERINKNVARTVLPKTNSVIETFEDIFQTNSKQGEEKKGKNNDFIGSVLKPFDEKPVLNSNVDDVEITEYEHISTTKEAKPVDKVNPVRGPQLSSETLYRQPSGVINAVHIEDVRSQTNLEAVKSLYSDEMVTSNYVKITAVDEKVVTDVVENVVLDVVNEKEIQRTSESDSAEFAKTLLMPPGLVPSVQQTLDRVEQGLDLNSQLNPLSNGGNWRSRMYSRKGKKKIPLSLSPVDISKLGSVEEKCISENGGRVETTRPTVTTTRPTTPKIVLLEVNTDRSSYARQSPHNGEYIIINNEDNGVNLESETISVARDNPDLIPQSGVSGKGPGTRINDYKSGFYDGFRMAIDSNTEIRQLQEQQSIRTREEELVSALQGQHFQNKKPFNNVVIKNTIVGGLPKHRNNIEQQIDGNNKDISSSMTSQILTEWGRWSECSGSCGIGYSKRHRSCLVLDRCYGKTMETKRCSLQPCPVVWGDWASWSACSATCGVGFADRRRTCFRRKGVAQETCNGYDVENRECYLTACKKHNNSLSTLEGFLIAAPFIGMSMLAFVFIIAKYCIKRRNSLKNRQVDSSPKEYDYRSSPVNSINSFSNDSHVKVKRSQSVTKAKRSNSAVTRGERSFVNVSAPTGYYKKNVRNNEKIQRETMRYTHYDGDRRDNKEKRKVSSEFQRIKTTRPRPTSNIYENYCGDYQDSHLPERENFKIPGSIPLSDTRLRQPVHTSHMKQTSVNGGRESAGNRVNTDHQLSRHSSKKSVKMRHHPSQTSSECFQFDKQMHLPKSVKIKEEHTLSSLQDMRTVKGSMSKESLRNSDYYFLPIKNETNQAQHKLTRNTSSSLKTSNVSHLKSESTLNSGKHRQQPVRQNLPRPKLSLYRDEPRLFNDRTELPMADTLTRALSVALATQEIRTDVTPQRSEQETRMLKAKTNGSIQSRNGNRKGRIRSHTSTNKYDNSARSHNTFRKSYSVLSVNTRDIKPTRFDDVTNLQSVSNNERSNELTLEVDKHDQQNGIKHDTSNSRVPTLNSLVPSSNSRVPTTNSQVSTPNSGVATSNLRVPTSKSQVPTPNLRVPTSNSRVPTSNSSVGGEQQTAYRQEPNRLSDERYKPFQREDAENDTSPSNAHNKSLQGSPSNEHDLTGIISSSHIPKTSTPISARRTFNSEKRHLSSKQDPRNVKEDSKKRVQLDGEIKTNDTYPPDVNHTDFVNFSQWKHSLSNNGTQNGGSLSNNGTQNGGCNKIKNPDSIQSELLLSTTEEQQNRVHKYFGLASDLSSELSSDGECFFSVPSSCQDLTELP